ncbi:MAG: hypothetical protein O3B95_03340 [Chloroflexi bacterium]|nr:hypothetical protein [Chloroflexota bacterium]
MKSYPWIAVLYAQKKDSVLGLFVLSFAVLITACSADAGQPEATATPEVMPVETVADPLQGVADLIAEVQGVGDNVLPLIFNVNLTDAGPDPAHLFIPGSRPVEIILRNRTRGEVHYRVVGLQPEQLRWSSEPEEEAQREAGISDEDHEAHHDRDFVAWRAESMSGIKPTGDEVHGYTGTGEIDAILFTATTLGTFVVVDPLHPEFSAQLTVF